MGIQAATGRLDPVHDQREVIASGVRPMMKHGAVYWTLFGLLGATVLWGAYAYVYQLINGLGVTGLNNQVMWGVYTVDLVTFIGLSYGGALVSAILRLTSAEWRTPITRIAEAVALVTLVVGSLFPLVHIGRPERAWEMIIHPQLSSPLVWDMVAITTYLLATIIFLYLPMIPDLAVYRDRADLKVGPIRKKIARVLSVAWHGLPAQRRRLGLAISVVSILIIPVAVSVHSVLAWAFSVTSRPGWNSTLFAPYFVMAALYSGVALVIVVVAAYRKVYHLEKYIGKRHFENLGFIMITLGATYLYFTFSELLTEGYVGKEDSVPVMQLLLTGKYSYFFWFFVVGGIILPILLVAFRATRKTWGVTTAAVLAVVAMWIKRFLIVIPPLAHPLIGEQIANYTPSWVEISITLGATAAVPLLLIVFFRFFPVLPVTEMVEEIEHQEGGENVA